MNTQTIMSLLQTVSIIIGIAVACSTLRTKSDDKAANLTEMQVDIRYIKEKVDTFDNLRETVLQTKSSVEAAHKRIDDHLRYCHGESTEPRS